jgi:hypothetical protein
MFDRKTIWVSAVLLGAALCPALQGQSGAVRVFTEPPGLTFYVDGQGFYSSASFNWPATSKHSITSGNQDVLPGQRFVFRAWQNNLTQTARTDLQSIIVTADPGLTWVKLIFDPSFAVRLNLCDLSGPLDCPASGRGGGVDVAQIVPQTVCQIVGGTTVCGNQNTTVSRFFEFSETAYLPAGSTVTVRASPNPGYIFTGWAQVAGSVGRPTAFEFSAVLNEPWLLAPQFQPANPLKISVNIATIPPRLRILADRTP